MKKLSLLAIIAFLAITGCAVAGQPKQDKPKDKMADVSQDQLVDNIREQIAWYDNAIKEATQKLEAMPEWQNYLAVRKKYNEAAKEFKASKVVQDFIAEDKKASSLSELWTVKNLQSRQAELKKLLGEGGK